MVFHHDLGGRPRETHKMPKPFKIGDHVRWNSEAGVSGTIVATHARDFEYRDRMHRAARDDPHYEIRSDKTDHVAAHKGSALEHVRGNSKT
jgi:hypothetical protein